MSDDTNLTRTYRFVVNKSDEVAVGTANYDISEESLGDLFVLRSIEVLAGTYFDPGEVLGKRITADGIIIPVVSWDTVREMRDAELQRTDWTQIPDAPLPSQVTQEFAIWRQQLRDLPQVALTAEEGLDQLEALIGMKP